MAPVTSFKALALVFVAALFATAAMAQEISPAPAPASGAGSVSASAAVIGASIVMSMVAILKQ